MGTDLKLVEQLCATAFGVDAVSISGISDVGQGRGAFSVVLRAELSWNTQQNPPEGAPASVVAKLPMTGGNGKAAIASGAYRREALAYADVLVDAPIRTPEAFAVQEFDDGSCALLLEDLTGHRSVDQLDGLGVDDAALVAETLAVFHRSWREQDSRRNTLPVRRNTIAGLPEHEMTAGLACLPTVWGDVLNDEERQAYARLVSVRPRLAQLFDDATDTLCHGDPRADNLVFGGPVDEAHDSGAATRFGQEVVLFDWQQMALQFGEADVAWLAATSLEPELRRTADAGLVEAYGGSMDRYRLGLALPGLAVLFLAQRELSTERTRRFVAASLQRIAAAIMDLEVDDLGG